MEEKKENNINRYESTANLYDLDQRDNLTADIPFYMEYAKKQNGNILELGCGTGRVSIELAKSGFSVTGIDLSEQMLAVYKDKIKSLPDDVKKKIFIMNGNMTNFEFNHKFYLIIAPFRVFQLLLTDNDVRNAFNCIKKHLDKNGIFIINVFRPYDR